MGHIKDKDELWALAICRSVLHMRDKTKMEPLIFRCRMIISRSVEDRDAFSGEAVEHIKQAETCFNHLMVEEGLKHVREAAVKFAKRQQHKAGKTKALRKNRRYD